jgi:hypothetical protein
MWGMDREAAVEQAALVNEAVALVRTFGRMYLAEVGAVASEVQMEILPSVPLALKEALHQSLYLSA